MFDGKYAKEYWGIRVKFLCNKILLVTYIVAYYIITDKN